MAVTPELLEYWTLLFKILFRWLIFEFDTVKLSAYAICHGESSKDIKYVMLNKMAIRT